LTATLSNLNRFQYFLQCQKPEKCAKQSMHLLIYCLKKVLLITQYIDKKILGIKKYGVKRLIKEFPNKKWSKRGAEDFQKRL